MFTYGCQLALDDCHLRRDRVIGCARREEQRELVLLDQLEREDLIVREPDPADRRAHTVRLTKAGKTLQAAVQADIRAMENEFLSDFTTADQRALFRMLTKLAHET